MQGVAATEERVGRLVEAELGPGLQAYLCHNAADCRLLRTILEREYRGRHQPKVVISPFLPRRHAVQPIQTAANYPRLMDLIEATHPVVFNYLVDQHSVEAILVCPSQQDAVNITCQAATVPQGLRNVLTHNFYRFWPAVGGQGFRSYWVTEPGGGPRLETTTAQRVRNQEDEVDAKYGKNTFIFLAFWRRFPKIVVSSNRRQYQQ